MKALLAAVLLCASSAAAASVGQAQFDLGRKVRNGSGVPRDAVRAYQLIQRAAMLQHPAAMFTLSNMLVAGEGVAPDRAAARSWLEAAAALENPEALQQLALHLQEGTLGFARDEVRAAQLLRQLAHAMKHRDHAKSLH
jgi:TPR repeat protein